MLLLMLVALVCLLLPVLVTHLTCRLATISLLFLPAIGWVAFNMAQPALNQLSRMNEIKEEAVPAGAGGKKKRGLAGAVGMGAALSMLAAQQADAATELSQLAATDNR
jgi:photosystem II PsbY protein